MDESPEGRVRGNLLDGPRPSAQYYQTLSQIFKERIIGIEG